MTPVSDDFGAMAANAWSLVGVALIVAATFAIGIWGSRSARTTTDFTAARREVREEHNAAAISGEYLSAASFLGVAGLVLKDGVDALWYPIGFAAGYLALMLFVAAPMRRSGAFTLPDFAEARLDSLRLRSLCTALVVLIGWLYLVPQLQAAGMTLAAIVGFPYWAGILVVAVIVLGTVATGVLRAVTLVQAFQYWVKLFAITVPAFALFIVFLGGAQRQALDAPLPPVFPIDTAVRIDTDVRLTVREPVWLADQDGTLYLQPGEHTLRAGSELRFPAGAPVPVVSDAEPDNATWLRPERDGAIGLLETYSVLVATFLGTMGLPHVLARFYTNPSGTAVRRTTLYVVAMLGAFYLFPTIFGLLSRMYAPQLLVTGETDAAVLLLPNEMLGTGWAGGLLASITAAGAFAAFLSTSSGLVVSLAGVLSSRDVLRGRSLDFRLLAVLACLVPAVLALLADSHDIARSVGLAFAMAASTFCPVLVLGIWWRGLTAAGAASGMVVGGSLVLIAALLAYFVGRVETWWATLIGQPALITVPVAFAVTVVVSRATRARVPAGVGRVMLRLHAPDRLGFLDQKLVAEPADQPETRGRHQR
ncbi:Sodium:solute symporter family protein [Saccharopolyspora antimicrobica]|uniref:Sodium:solute symporter family protein n=2 Tax=Saccharopolyspora antimicrobica TaxID=455193 RepID=A0A1I4X4A4_9PSEU|nr:sodium:solute symporter family protein [Saccharopolyspora antimicrobica]SFN20482.1 Sodium:solute symporter family protein [Saccharopolyspora antimicrobica]